MKKVFVIALALMFTCAAIFDLGHVCAKSKAPEQVKDVKLTDPLVPGSKYNAVTIEWSKATSASKYEVYRQNQKATWNKYKVVIKNKKNKKKYTVKDKYKVKTIGRYHYRVYKFERKWTKRKTLSKTQYNSTKLHKGKTYKFKIRGKAGSRCGKFSAVSYIKIGKTGKVTIKDSAGTSAYYETKEGHDFMKKARSHVGGIYKRAGMKLKGVDLPEKNSIDCTGLVRRLFEVYVGIDLPGGAHKKMIDKALALGASSIKSMDEVAVGDLLFYKTSGGTGQHVAIYAGDGNVLEAASSKRGWEDPYKTTGPMKKALNGVFVRPQSKMKPYKIIRILDTQAEQDVK